ncbi:MAG: MBL fold metallo-hydrolase [Candidatus Gastranaerophilales bacterium]|nr:MBL fold metallo-hydrolase [Candidatus Gastranaerophilales bacterium]
MIIKTIKVGSLSVNNYIIIDEETKNAVIIDAGGDYEAIKQILEQYSVNLKFILNTHGHFDHISGDYELQEKEGVQMFIHKNDEYLVEMLQSHLKMYEMPMVKTPKINKFVQDEETLNVANMTFKVIHTPGHTPGGVCYLIENVLFAGDTLFAHSVGRTDLPKGSYEQLKTSIKTKLFTLDDGIIVYPGHGRSTTIGEEKLNNPFFGANVQVF